MTNNIVAQFASNFWKSSESARAQSLGFSVGDLKEYPVVSGSIFNEEYNETLDSGTLVLSQVQKEDRLFKIRPYDFVRVFDKSGNTNFEKWFLADTFNEKENNIKEHLFGYTINLMSETKFLEKIQCPNLTITHDVIDGTITKKTIYQHIKQYMELFVPKIKFSEDGNYWNYVPLITMDQKGSTVRRQFFSSSNFNAQGEITLTFNLNNSAAIQFSVKNIKYTVVSTGSSSFEFNGTDTLSYNSITGTFTFYGKANVPMNGYIDVSYDFLYVEEETDLYKRFNNVLSADMNFAAPTLRQLLTTLMQQVGCIPVVKNRCLSFLDFQKDAVPFDDDGDYTLGNTVNFIHRSLSSDSYVNTLVNMSEQVLDSENEVISETLCFRDSDNVLLKQTQNLCLETSLPIYKVNKCILHAPGKTSGLFSSSYNCFYGYKAYQGNEWRFELPTTSEGFPWICYKETSINNGTLTIKFRFSSFPQNAIRYINMGTIYLWSYDSNTGKYTIIDEIANAGVRLTRSNVTADDPLDFYAYDSGDGTWSYQPFNTFSYTYTKTGLNTSAAGFFMVGTFFLFANEDNEADMIGQEKNFSFIRFSDNDPTVRYHDPYAYMRLNNTTGEVEVGHNWERSSDIYNYNRYVAAIDLSFFLGVQSWDISKLVVENSVRQLLDTDFTKMVGKITYSGNNVTSFTPGELTYPSTWTVDNISKYVYGTVGYAIGSKKISGFSEVFYVGQATSLGWVTKDYTYLENIVTVLSSSVSQQSVNNFDVIYDTFEGTSSLNLTQGDYNYDAPPQVVGQTYMNDLTTLCQYNVVGFEFDFYNVSTNAFDNDKHFYTSFFVDIFYQPLNSFNMSYVKSDEDVPLPLSQYDSSVSGLTDFDRLSIHEQEQVDRIGNETIIINQRTTDFSKIKDFSQGPLVFKDDVNRDGSVTSEDNSVDYIIFKRSLSVNNNCFNVSYVGSKDAVLKNYFTSIRTKYRAYQYVDYNQSVLRKEKDVFYIRIATDRYDGDDRVNLGPNSNTAEQLKYITNFMYDLENDSLNLGTKRSVSYEVETDTAKVHAINTGDISEELQIVKNSVSTIATKNCMAFIYEYVDNVGAGPYIMDITDNQDIGGIPQTWQIWGDAYSTRHNVSFANYIGFYDIITSTAASDPANYTRIQIKKIQKSPVVDSDFSREISFSIVDENRYGTHKRTFYKDNAERINHTVQFIYYAPNGDVLFGEDFIKGAPVINRFSKSFDKVVFSNDFSFNENPHSLSTGEVSMNPDFNRDAPGVTLVSEYMDGNTGEWTEGYPHLYVKGQYNGTNYSVVKLCHVENGNMYSDIAVFYLGNSISKEFYFMINDTKTDYVYGESNGVLYLRYKVVKNSSDLLSWGVARYCVDNL